MADTKTTALTELTSGNIADADLVPIVDVSDTTMAATGTVKKTLWSSIKAQIKTYTDTLYSALGHTHAASDITSGTVATARLGSGTANSTTYLRGDQTWATVSGGSPAGSGTEIQYRNGSSFGSMSGTAWDDTNRALSVTGATVTTSNPVQSFTQTWNAGAVTFTGWKLNITDTASASASLLMDLQVGGASKFAVKKNGSVTFANSAQLLAGSNIDIGTAADTLLRAASNSYTFYISGGDYLSVSASAVTVASSIPFRIGSNNGVKRLANGVTEAVGASEATTGVAFRSGKQTVSQLPAASGCEGAYTYVTDSNSTTRHATVAGGGSSKVLVFSDGTNWLIV